MSERSAPKPDKDVRTEQADHAGPAFAPQIRDCADTVRAIRPLRCLGQLTNGVFDFAVSAAGAWPGEGSMERIGRELDLCVRDLGRSCAGLDSGPLIRVVIQGRRGALFHMLKLSDQCLFACSEGGAQDQVDDVDHRLFDILERTFARLGMVSLNWGGFRPVAEDFAGEAGTVLSHEDRVPSSTVGWQRVPRLAGRVELRRSQALLQAALDPDGLHYVALFQEGHLLLAEDILDHPNLVEYFQRSSPFSRREAYQSVALMCWRYQSRRESLLEENGLGPEVRLVLDVARGALFFLPVSEDLTLVGVTLHQNRLLRAEADLRRAEEKLSEHRQAA
jgi:hypothetical protein